MVLNIVNKMRNSDVTCLGNRKPVQESQESTEKQNENKEASSGNTEPTMWRLSPTGVWDSNTDNSSEYPPFVMKAVKV